MPYPSPNFTDRYGTSVSVHIYILYAFFVVLITKDNFILVPGVDLALARIRFGVSSMFNPSCMDEWLPAWQNDASCMTKKPAWLMRYKATLTSTTQMFYDTLKAAYGPIVLSYVLRRVWSWTDGSINSMLKKAPGSDAIPAEIYKASDDKTILN